MQIEEGSFTGRMLIPPSDLMEKISFNVKSSWKVLGIKKESFFLVLKNFASSIKLNIGYISFFINYLIQPAILSRA